MDTSGLIDNRNLELWNTLRSIHEFEIHKENRSDYLSFSINDKTIISVPFDNLDSASFTHELLHVYLRTKKIFIGGSLKLSIKSNQTLSKIFSNDLIDHISNCLNHIKMLPEFIKLGYDKNEFLSDYFINKLTKNEILEIKKHYKKNALFKKVYKAKAIDYFIGKYFAAIACPNDSFNYDEQLEELKQIDADLFQILNKFLTDWIHFDYKDTAPIMGSYHSFLFNFIENLEKWTKGKTIK